MTPEQFAQTIKTKYPEYKNTEDAKLVSAVLEKYPQYKSQVSMPEQKGFGQRVNDARMEKGANAQAAIAGEGQYAGQSAFRRGATAAAEIATAPLAMGYEALPENKYLTFRSGLKNLGDKVGTGFNKIIDMVSDVKPLQDWVMKNPEASKGLEEVLGTVAPIGMIAGEITGAVGATKVVSKSLATAKDAARAVMDGTKDAASAIGEVARGASKSVASPFNAEPIMQRVARIPKGAQAKFEKAAGESVGSYLNKRDIYEGDKDIPTQLFERFSVSKQAADEALASLPGVYKPAPLRSALTELLAREKRVSAPGAMSKDLKRARELANKFNKDGLDMTEINEVKRMFEKNVRLDFVKQNLPEGVARSTNIDNLLREWQFAQAEKLGLKNLPDINKETRLAKQLLDDIGRESAGSAGNNALTLTDYVLLAGGDPTAIAGFIGKKFLSSKKVQSAAAKKLYKGEKVGMPKAQFGKPKPGLEEFNKKYEN